MPEHLNDTGSEPWHGNLGSNPATSVSLGPEEPSRRIRDQYAGRYYFIGQPLTNRGKLEDGNPVYIKFFIRTPHDPIGSSSPRFEASADMELEEIFDCYLSETYGGHPPIVEDYSFMELDLASRTLGKRYSYVEAKALGLKVRDTEWFENRRRDSRVIMLVSSDRIPKGNYKHREAAGAGDGVQHPQAQVQVHEPARIDMAGPSVDIVGQ